MHAEPGRLVDIHQDMFLLFAACFSFSCYLYITTFVNLLDWLSCLHEHDSLPTR